MGCTAANLQQTTSHQEMHVRAIVLELWARYENLSNKLSKEHLHYTDDTHFMHVHVIMA